MDWFWGRGVSVGGRLLGTAAGCVVINPYQAWPRGVYHADNRENENENDRTRRYEP